MKGFDWFTIVLVGLGVVMLVASIRSRKSGRIPAPGPNLVKGAAAFIGAALLLQFFRGFDVRTSDVKFQQQNNGIVITGTLRNPHSFKLNAIVVEISAIGAGGKILETERVVVKELVAHGSSGFTARLNVRAVVTRVSVTAEGFWT
jgi:hypothetical protein